MDNVCVRFADLLQSIAERYHNCQLSIIHCPFMAGKIAEKKELLLTVPFDILFMWS